MYGIAGLLTGRTLGGRYRIDAVVGRGGMGAVYRASDERLGRAVALKVIGIEAQDPAEHGRLQARFLREARAAAALHHPNVVAVHDFGTDEALGLDYIVMELLQGEDLAMRLARTGPPPAHVSLSILCQAARGLAAGHRAGMVHRDVKPGNLFLQASDHPDEPRVRVLDFGIALVAADDATAAQLTEFGRAPFSPAYASPEQMRGEERTTPASDVFSLAAVGYHLLTGLRPFTATDPAQMAAEAAEAVRLLPQRAPHLPHTVMETLRRGLSLDPRDRFRDAGELADALSHVAPAPGTPTFTDRAATPPAPAPRPQRASLAAAVSVEPSPDDATRVLTGRPPRRAVVNAPTMYAPARHVEPRAPLAPAPPPVPVQSGVMRRAASALWNMTLTACALALFVGAWFLAGNGAVNGETTTAYGGAAAAVLFTPLAVHRLTGRRGRLFLGVVASGAATAAAVYYMGSEADPAVTLTAIFGVQVVASFVVARLTRRRPYPNPYAVQHG